MSPSYVPAIRDRGPAAPLESLRVRLGRGSLALESTVGLTSTFVAHGVRARFASAGIDKNRAFSSSSRQLGEQYETCMGGWLMSAATIWPTASGFASMRLIHPVRISIASVPVRRGSGGAYLFTLALSRRRFCGHVGRRTRTRPRQRRVGPFAPELRRPAHHACPLDGRPMGAMAGQRAGVLEVFGRVDRVQKPSIARVRHDRQRAGGAVVPTVVSADDRIGRQPYRQCWSRRPLRAGSGSVASSVGRPPHRCWFSWKQPSRAVEIHFGS